MKPSEQTFLAADIGGSHSRLLLGRAVSEGRWEVLQQADLISAAFDSVGALMTHFLGPCGTRPMACCLALAGPMQGQRITLTNLPWAVDAAALARQLGLPEVRLINDLAAQAHGLDGLTTDDLYCLQAVEPEPGALRALVGAGTGLGMTLCHGRDTALQVFPGEGGHAGFAPANGEELALLQTLLPALGHVSLEVLLSGHGLERIHRFCLGVAPAADVPDAAHITAAALADDGVARRTVHLFLRLLGSAAGNLAVTTQPRGGVFLTGGIVPRLLPLMASSGLLQAFLDKPPMQPLLARIPLCVVLDPLLGLKGAARLALHALAASA